jgi:NADH-quinone oxidoreductase subunit M
MAFPWLSAITFIPLIGALILFGLPPDRPGLARRFGLFFSLLAGLLALFVWRDFVPTEPGLQFVERYEWIPTLGVQYFLGIDGLGLVMVLLSAFVVPFAMLASWRVAERVHLFFGLLLLLEAGLFGSFTALNFFHWFIFWEVGLVPAYFLIKIWGGEKRVQAAGQFFVYTFAGSVALLLAFLALYLVSGTFDLMELAEKGRSGELADLLSLRLTWFESFRTKEDLAQFIFLLAFLGFAVKVDRKSVV